MRRRTSTEIEVDGLQIGYERAGEGPALVLLHGYVGDGRATWRRQLDELSDEFTVVAWDAPGAGRSSDPPESFRLSHYADCLAGLVGALSLARPHVAGLSLGGALALELYRRHPTIPRSLVLAGAYAGWAGSLPPEAVQLRLRQALELSRQRPDQLVAAVIPTLFSSSAPQELVDEFAASVAEFHPPGLRAMARSSAEADLRDMLPLVAVPTLLLYGDEDVRAPVDVGKALQAAIPGSRLVVLPGVGHMSSVEAADRFNSEVRAFLRATDLNEGAVPL